MDETENVDTVKVLVLDVPYVDVVDVAISVAVVVVVVVATAVVGTSVPKNDEAISESVDAAADCTSLHRPVREDWKAQGRFQPFFPFFSSLCS